MTQRHMQQIEDLQAQLQAHTQMMALQQVRHMSVARMLNSSHNETSVDVLKKLLTWYVSFQPHLTGSVVTDSGII